MARRLLERVAPHPLDHDLVRQADAQLDASAARRLRGEGLGRERHRVTRVGGHHRGPQLDVGHLPPDDREQAQRLEAEDLWNPVAVEPLLFGESSRGDVVVHCPVADVPREDSYAHGGTLRAGQAASTRALARRSRANA